MRKAAALGSGRTMVGVTTCIAMWGSLCVFPGAGPRAHGEVIPGRNIAYCYGSGSCCVSPANQTSCCDIDTASSAESDDIRGKFEGESATASLSCVSQGFTTCLGPRACCLPNGTCTMADGRCCDDLGGIAGTAGSNCGTAACGACCTGTVYPFACSVKPAASCTGSAAGFAGAGTTCAGGTCTNAYICCKPDQSCDNHALSFCDSLGGTPHYGTLCKADDPDGDEIGTLCGDNCPDDANPDQTDSDGDGEGNECDICPNDADNDIDADGDCGDVDNCPSDYNPGQENADGDTYGDVCDPCPYDANNDIDGDGLCADVDNCDNVPNPEQENCDSWSGDEDGDACDPDIDDDGILNADDACDYTPYPYVVLNLFIQTPGHSLHGTVRWDVDGDCDVDAADAQQVQQFSTTEYNCNSGVSTLQPKLCP